MGRLILVFWAVLFLHAFIDEVSNSHMKGPILFIDAFIALVIWLIWFRKPRFRNHESSLPVHTQANTTDNFIQGFSAIGLVLVGTLIIGIAVFLTVIFVGAALALAKILIIVVVAGLVLVLLAKKVRDLL